MAITIGNAYIALQEALKVQNITTAQDAWWLLEYITSKPYNLLILEKQRVLNLQQEELLTSVINDIQAYKPIAYIIGWVPFLDLIIETKPPILIPRPETEYWCNQLIRELRAVSEQNFTILDMCTGSGCIGLSLAKAFPKAQIYAVDINPQACALTAQNALKNDIKNIHIIESDLFEHVPDISFDLIVSNPPYIAQREFETLDSAVKLWEDTQALIAKKEGLFLIEKIIQASKAKLIASKLKHTSIAELWIEIGYTQGPAVSNIMLENTFNKVEVIKDLSDMPRVVKAKL